MCDYSLMHIKSRAAQKDDLLVTRNFNTGSRGFSDLKDTTTAVCVLPGTELAFEKEITVYGRATPYPYTTARFRQINTEHRHLHHDALELPGGELCLLTFLSEGQFCKVLQLPAAPRNEAEAAAQRRVEAVG